MAKKGLIFSMNQKPEEGDLFIVRQLFRFIPSFTNATTTMIELELHKNNICVLSFFDHDKGSNKNKYKIRTKLGAGHTRAIFRACIEAYSTLKEDYALVFSSSNDLDSIQEYNARYSAYLFFLTRHFKNYDQYIQQGSIALSTLIIYHQSFQYKDEADEFYKDFEKKVKEELKDIGESK